MLDRSFVRLRGRQPILIDGLILYEYKVAMVNLKKNKKYSTIAIRSTKWVTYTPYSFHYSNIVFAKKLEIFFCGRIKLTNGINFSFFIKNILSNHIIFQRNYRYKLVQSKYFLRKSEKNYWNGIMFLDFYSTLFTQWAWGTQGQWVFRWPIAKPKNISCKKGESGTRLAWTINSEVH